MLIICSCVQMELKRKYKNRLILDESQSFGMIGAHGKGITEYFGIPVRPLVH